MRALLLCTALATLFVAPSQGETILAFLSTSQQLKRFYELVLGVEEVRDALSRMQFGYTVFAPTNEAILRFMTPGIQGLLQKDPEALRKLVAYHVAVSQDVIRTVNIPVTHAGMVTSLYGSKILVERSANGFRVNSRAHIEQPDTILESLRTGCVHVVDQVLTYPGWFPDDDLVTLFRKPDDIRAFYATIWEAKEELGLNEQGPITVFVPSNSAFAREGLSTKGITLSTLLEEDRKLFIRILKYHIVHSKYLTGADLAQPSYAQTLDVHQGKASYVVFQKDATGAIDINNGEAKISKPAGVPALNGVYYIIDHLLLPTGVAVPDVNYSVARQEGLQAALASAETPEPLPELVLEVNTKRSDKKVHAHKLPLVLLFLVLAALLLYRVAVPAPDLLSKKAQNRQQKADGCLLVFGAFVLIMFLLPGTSWMLPPALKWTSEEVRATVSRMVSGTTTSVSPVAKDQTDITEARDREGKLRDLLHSLTYDMYRHQLVAYGLDRVELIAMATPLDGQRAGIKQAHWSNLVHQARIRSPMTEPDFTPPPPEQARVPMDARTPTPPDLSHAQILVKEFEKEEGARMTPSPQSVYHPVAKPVTPPPVFVDPEAGLKKFVLAHIAIPSTGGSTIECTFSNRHGNFAHRGSKQLDNIKYVRVRNLAEAEALRYQLGKQNLKDVSPAATIVTTMVATKPTRRFLRSFAKTVGTPNAPNSDMRCDGKMAQRMKDKKFSIEAYAKVPVEGRRLCEWANNPMVKALTNLNANDKATEEHLEDAKRNLNKLDVLMIEGQESRSMLLLMSKLNLSEGSYIPCAPYDDPATAVSSLRVTYVIAQDNDPDRLLNAEISHIFHTKYAGTIEQTKDSKRVECSPQPIVCFDENDQNEERKAKDLYVNVQATLQRSSSRASVMCAGECRLPKD